MALELLELDACAGLFELGLDRVGFLLVHAFLDGARSRVDEVLGLLEAEAGDGADDLDHLDLLATRRGQHHVEGRLLLLRGRAVAAGDRAARCDRDRSGGGDAPLLLDLVLELDQLEHGHAPELLENGVNSCHYSFSSWVSDWVSDTEFVSDTGSVSGAASACAVSSAGVDPPCASSCSIRASISP